MSKFILKYLIAFGGFLLLPLNSALPAEPPTVTTLAIMNFTNRSPAGEWQWLSKGLADMLITDLSQAGELQVVERERMQKLFEEMALSTTGLIDEATAAKFGRVAKVDKALFGSFLKEGDNLSIEAHIIDVATGELIRVEWVRGKAEDVFKLEKELAFKIIKNLHVKLTKAERDSIRYIPTDNIDAATHFYAGIDLYDKGKYTEAFVEFRGAIRKDQTYANALFYSGEIYYILGEFQHAVIEYEKLVSLCPENSLKAQTQAKLGTIYTKEIGNLSKAIQVYRDIANNPKYGEFGGLHPNPREWAFARWAAVLKEQGKFEEAFNVYQQLLEMNPKSGEGWVGVHHISRGFIHFGRPLQGKFARIMILSQNSPSYREDYITKKYLQDAWASDRHDFVGYTSDGTSSGSYIFKKPDCWGSMTYLFAAEEGFAIKKIIAEVTALGNFQFECAPFGNLSGYISFSEKTTSKKTLRKEWEGDSPIRFFLLRVGGGGSKPPVHVYDWQVTAELVPAPPDGTIKITCEPEDAKILINGVKVITTENGITFSLYPGKHWVEAHKSDFVRVSKRVVVKSHETTEVNFLLTRQRYDPEKMKAKGWKAAPMVVAGGCYKPIFFQDKASTFWIIFRKYCRDFRDSDIWAIRSFDGYNWLEPYRLPLPINTTEMENPICIAQSEKGEHILIFYRHSAPGGEQILLSTSPDMMKWSPPIKLDKKVYSGIDTCKTFNGNPLPVFIVDNNSIHTFDGTRTPPLREILPPCKAPRGFRRYVVRGVEGTFWMLISPGNAQTNRMTKIYYRKGGTEWSEVIDVGNGIYHAILLKDERGHFIVMGQRNADEGICGFVSEDEKHWSSAQVLIPRSIPYSIQDYRIIKGADDRYWVLLSTGAYYISSSPQLYPQEDKNQIENSSGLEKLEPLEEGLRDLIMDDLAKVKGVTVVERESLEKIVKVFPASHQIPQVGARSS